MDIYNKYARQRGRVLEFQVRYYQFLTAKTKSISLVLIHAYLSQDLLYGYRRVDPLHGADYVLDLLLLYKKFKGRKVTVPVRRHTYLRQTFAELEMIEENEFRSLHIDNTQPPNSHADLTTKLQSKSREDLNLFNSDVIHIILPLSGRLESFQRFLLNFERTCLQTGEEVQLMVVLFDDDNQVISEIC